MPNEGFFSGADLAEITKTDKKVRRFSCRDCGLDTGISSPRMPTGGRGGKRIMIIGEAPGRHEDEQNEQFVGKAGKRLAETLTDLGIDLDKDCWKENACCCRPPENKTPTPTQILACQKRLFESIRAKGPKILILLGKSAVDAVIGKYWGTDIGAIGRWRGFGIPLHDLNCFAYPTFHPSYILREDNEESAAPVIFIQDLLHAIREKDRPLPEKLSDNMIKPLDGPSAIRHIEALLKRPPRYLAFDFETTGLKPHAKGHRIVCASLCSTRREAVAFWVDSVVEPFLVDLLNSPVPKIASNLKFEDSWAREILAVRPKNWRLDTMLATHTQDNRQLITSIKFQGFVRFGVAGYEDEIEPYKQSGSRNANALNRMEEVRGWKKMLIYCGMDSLLEYNVARQQMKELGIE